jgi:hypothetical protein
MPSSPPCGHTEGSCLPCHRRSWNPLDPDRRAAATRQAHHPLGCLRPIPDRIIFDELIQVLVFGCGCAGSPTPAARRPPCAAAATNGSAPGWPSSCAVRCWPPTTGCSAWSWSIWWWTAASPRRAAAGRSRAQPGGPPQTRAEALDGHRSGRHPAGHAARPANHATTGCWRRRWSPSPGRRATRTASGAPGRRLRLEALPTGSWPKAGWSARSPH